MKHVLHVIVDAAAHRDAVALELSVDRQLRARMGARGVVLHLVSAVERAAMQQGVSKSLHDGIGMYIPIVSGSFFNDADAYLRHRTYLELGGKPYDGDGDQDGDRAFGVFPLLTDPLPVPALLSPVQQQWMNLTLRRPVSYHDAQGVIDDAWLEAVLRHMDFLLSALGTLNAERLGGSIPGSIHFSENSEVKAGPSRKSWLRRLRELFAQPPAVAPPVELPSHPSLNSRYKHLRLTQISIVRLLYLYVHGNQITLADLYQRYVEAYGDEAISGRAEFYYRLCHLCQEGFILMESVSMEHSVIRKLPNAEVLLPRDLDS